MSIHRRPESSNQKTEKRWGVTFRAIVILRKSYFYFVLFFMYIVDREKTPLCSNKFFPEHSGAPGTTIIKKNCAAVPSFSLQGKKDKMREIESSKQTFVTLNLISANTYKSGVFVGPFF